MTSTNARLLSVLPFPNSASISYVVRFSEALVAFDDQRARIARLTSGSMLGRRAISKG